MRKLITPLSSQSGIIGLLLLVVIVFAIVGMIAFKAYRISQGQTAGSKASHAQMTPNP